MLYSSQFHENFVFHIKENWGVFHMGKTQSVNKNMICYSASKKNHVWRNIIQCNWYKEAANWGQGKMTLGLFNSQRESVNGIIMQCLLSSQRDKNFLNWEVRMCVLDFNLNTLHLKYHLQSVKWTNTCIMDLQSVLKTLPLLASALYHKTKLCVHYFTIYNVRSCEVICYVWHKGEGAGGLTASEFASCIIDYLTKNLQCKNYITL